MNPDPTSKTRTPQKWISTLGTLLVLLSFYYIGTQLWGYRETLESWTPTTAAIVAVGFGIITYALANYLLAAAWIWLLRLCGEVSIDWRNLCQIYGKSQIAKYIPGNIAHIAGRHAMGRLVGVSHGHLAIAALYEIIGLVSAALIITLVGGRSVLDQFTSISWSIFVLPVILIAYLSTPWILQRFRPDTTPVSPLLMLPPLIYYALFFLVSGIALVVIGIYTESFTADSNNLIILSAFAISWSVGFLTPGAPSGIGIREAILILLLSPFTSDANALILALLFRLVTIGGDTVFYLISLASGGGRNKTIPLT
ncbi:MAG: hypothetical protein AB2792_12315 [Candidatus Thiodiazotropha sp.]